MELLFPRGIGLIWLVDGVFEMGVELGLHSAVGRSSAGSTARWREGARELRASTVPAHRCVDGRGRRSCSSLTAPPTGAACLDGAPAGSCGGSGWVRWREREGAGGRGDTLEGEMVRRNASANLPSDEEGMARWIASRGF